MPTDLSALPLVQFEEGILYLPVSTQENACALSNEAMEQSIEALNLVAIGKIDARVAVLVGLGKHFSVGGNVRGFAEAEDTEQHILDVAAIAHALVARVSALQIPVVAAMKGATAGAGLSLCLSADVVVGGNSSRLAFAYSAIGLSPDGGMSYFLPRVVGRTRAATLLLTSAQLSGEEARDMGIISHWVGDGDVDVAAAEFARTLAAGPHNSYASIKQSLAVAEEGSLDSVLRTERFNIARNSVTPNGREGVAAFTQKRAPKFSD